LNSKNGNITFVEKKLKPEHSLPNLAEIARGMVACGSNALELIEESSTISAGSHFARAYFLLHTACEELTKFSILELEGNEQLGETRRLGNAFGNEFVLMTQKLHN
jgi:AbiV family abortive infection protein